MNKKPVVSLEDGRKLGRVSDLLIDPQTKSLAAFEIEGDEGKSVLPRDHVRNIGDDAITVDSVSATQSGANALPGLALFSSLQGKKVVDSAGTLLGELDDVEIDPTTGQISTVLVKSGGVLGIGAHIHRLPAGDVFSFGPSLVTVNAVVTASDPSG